VRAAQGAVLRVLTERVRPVGAALPIGAGKHQKAVQPLQGPAATAGLLPAGIIPGGLSPAGRRARRLHERGRQPVQQVRMRGRRAPGAEVAPDGSRRSLRARQLASELDSLRRSSGSRGAARRARRPERGGCGGAPAMTGAPLLVHRSLSRRWSPSAEVKHGL
jgi:hypothetical protein